MLELDRTHLASVMASIGADEDFARAVRMELEDRFGWSLAYFDEIELRHRFASHHGYDELDDVPDELWADVWPLLRRADFWRNARWLDHFTGDRLHSGSTTKRHRHSTRLYVPASKPGRGCDGRLLLLVPRAAP